MNSMKVCHLNQCNPDAAVNTNIVSMIHEKSSNLKFTRDANRTGKLWIQFMDFASIARMLIRAERTGDWNLHIHASEQMLLFFAAARHNNYLTLVLLYLPDIKNLCTCLKSKYETVGLFTILRKDKLFWRDTFTDQVIVQDLMLSGKSESGLINKKHTRRLREQSGCSLLILLPTILMPCVISQVLKQELGQSNIVVCA